MFVRIDSRMIGDQCDQCVITHIHDAPMKTWTKSLDNSRFNVICGRMWPLCRRFEACSYLAWCVCVCLVIHHQRHLYWPLHPHFIDILLKPDNHWFLYYHHNHKDFCFIPAAPLSCVLCALFSATRLLAVLLFCRCYLLWRREACLFGYSPGFLAYFLAYLGNSLICSLHSACIWCVWLDPASFPKKLSPGWELLCSVSVHPVPILYRIISYLQYLASSAIFI